MNTRSTADVALLTLDPLQVLLVLRRWDPFAGRWALPGGHCDPGERDTDTAVRELHEETGISIPACELRLIDVYSDPDRDPRGHYITTAHGAVLAVPPAPRAADDAADARWLKVTPAGHVVLDGRRQRLAFDHEQILSDAIRALT
ncbi:NUDIX hydrolase [Streptomyces sp. SM12]|uniref:NUDIX domain-containing protein n=1 Tax=Streptomyces sp. SM12 TaxID=1071602 RepID=UPI000CD5AD5C|nr:NUDIX hydrolase [Streptomyces sp. SM12]